MRKLNSVEISEVSGGGKFFNIVGGALFGGVIEGVLGFCVGGPVGFVVGFGHGAYEGAAVTIIYEASMGLTETLHSEFR